MQSGTNSLFEEQNLTDSIYTFSDSRCRRVLTAPAGLLSELGRFKKDKQFILLQQFVISCNQLIHKSEGKYDIQSDEGQTNFRNYLEHLQALFPAFQADSCNRKYRDSFSKAYSTLYTQGELCYLTEIWDSAQQAFLFLWVNGQKYPFSQEVLSFGSKLVCDNFRLQNIIQAAYVKILDEVPETLESIIKQIKFVLQQFDKCWTTYQQKYIQELMNVQHQAKFIIVKAIELQRSLNTEEIGNKIRLKFVKSPMFYEIRNKLIFQISKINSVANDEGKGRDDLHPDILIQAEGLLRKITPQQSKAVRVLAQKIKSSFAKIRQILRKYDNCIDQIDPQLKNNQDLVQALMQYETSWEKGQAYFMDGQKTKTFIDFTNVIQTVSEKYESFKDQLQCRDSVIFMTIPSLMILKALDDEHSHFFQSFLSQSQKNIRQMYDSLRQHFQEWKIMYRQSYLYFNAVQKELMGLELKQQQKEATLRYKNYQNMLSKIKQLSVNLQRSSPVDWNSLLEAALIDC